MRVLFISLLCSLFPLASVAQCWSVTNLKGYSAYEAEHYEYSKNGMSKSIFNIDITKDHAKLNVVNGAHVAGIEYMPVSSSSMVGFYVDGNISVVETWAITNQNKVLYSKVVNNHESVTGTTSFVGDVVGDCATN
ncbi:hypothetical protein ABN357_12400 [Providencia rettgeri]|uniref:hypothetical protein n=1 Tax=Providencia TaxID=586 RepID=UPI001B35C1C7|nr:hypothetical protein [Providencia rettgeri]EHZ7763057.1 hypothetical protein [Providencia rettgeri]EIJ7166199.1 hypothetical protein [Providencia rettgeri]EJD6046022.1 hypothetical protein [Providencia rettgeri]ELR5103966.1 hypothetical protein [Providencia rettgeri]ELR5279125.1 hypothetical protein [Providencia rettgeri]